MSVERDQAEVIAAQAVERMRDLVTQYDEHKDSPDYEPRLMIYEVNRLADFVNGDDERMIVFAVWDGNELYEAFYRTRGEAEKHAAAMNAHPRQRYRWAAEAIELHERFTGLDEYRPSHR